MRGMTTISPLAGAILNSAGVLVDSDVSLAEALDRTMEAIRSQIAGALYYLTADPNVDYGMGARRIISDALDLVEYPPPPPPPTRSEIDRALAHA